MKSNTIYCDNEALTKESERLLAYIYDHLGEDTIRIGFANQF